MKTKNIKSVIVISVLTLFTSIKVSAQYDAIDWATYTRDEFNTGVTFDGEDIAEQVIIDKSADDDVYVVGRTKSVNITAATCTTQTVTHGTDASQGYAYLAKYDKCGAMQWIRYVGKTDASCALSSLGCSEWGFCIALDENSDDGTDNGDADTHIYIGGEIRGGTLPNAFSCTGGYSTSLADDWEGFIAEFNSSGDILNWTILGGSSTSYPGSGSPTIDEVLGLAVNEHTHDVFATGYTESSDMIGTYANAYQATMAGKGDCFIARFDQNLSTLTYFSYFGGSGVSGFNDGVERGHSIISQEGRCIIVGGQTICNDFLIVGGTVESANLFSGFAGFDGTYHGSVTPHKGAEDAFVLSWRISDLGTSGPTWGTYIGGNWDDRGRGTTVYNSTIYTTGWTRSDDLATSIGAYQTAKIGGTGTSDYDAYICSINSTTGAKNWFTYFGGTDDESPTEIKATNIGNMRFVYLAGITKSDNVTESFPNPTPTTNVKSTLAGAHDGFLAVLRENTSSPFQSLIYNTYFGGSDDEFENPSMEGAAFISYGPGLDLGTNNSPYLCFSTKSTNIMTAGVTPECTLNTTYGSTGAATNFKGDAAVIKLRNTSGTDECTASPCPLTRLGVENNAVTTESTMIFPNPSSDKFTIIVNNVTSTEVNIDLYDLNGKLILIQPFQLDQGTNVFTIDLTGNAEGIYICKIHYGDSFTEQKLIKQ